MARPNIVSPLRMARGVARFPWWFGLALAVVAYLALHEVASGPMAVAAHPGQIGPVLARNVARSLATLGQYLLPAIFVLGAAVSAWRRHVRRSLVNHVAGSGSAAVLDDMTWLEFEWLVGEAFRLDGYRVAEAGGAGPDGGIDLVLVQRGERHLVQCKQWKATKVGVAVVRELFGVMAKQGAAGGFVVTSGSFTPEAWAFAKGTRVQLIDGAELHRLIHRVRRTGAMPPDATREAVALARAQADARTASWADARADAMRPTAPHCPLCAKAMVQRVATRGTAAGAAFWGCSAFPACKGTRELN